MASSMVTGKHVIDSVRQERREWKVKGGRSRGEERKEEGQKL